MWAAIGVFGGFVLGAWAAAACLVEGGAIRDWGKYDASGEVEPPTLDPWQPGRMGVLLGMRTYREGSIIPPGWGFAYRAWDRDAAVFMPLPFNLAARWVRAAYMKMRFPDWDSKPTLDDRVAVEIQSAVLEAEGEARRLMGVARQRIEDARAAERRVLTLIERAERLTSKLPAPHTAVPT